MVLAQNQKEIVFLKNLISILPREIGKIIKGHSKRKLQKDW